jgi:hypothetical protein
MEILFRHEPEIRGAHPAGQGLADLGVHSEFPMNEFPMNDRRAQRAAC